MSAPETNQPVIGVSTATLLLIVPPGPNYGERLNAFCKRSRLKLQVLPFWWMREVRHVLALHEKHVISYEGRWNETETPQQLAQRLLYPWKQGWDPAAAIGPILFGFPKQSRQRVTWLRNHLPNASAVDTDGGNRLVETSPTNWEEIEKHLKAGGNICVDLWHLRGNKNSVAGNEKGRKRLVDLIKNNADKIKLIHFQTRSMEELDRFLSERHYDDTFLFEALCLLAPVIRQYNVPIIIELVPCFEETLFRVAKQIKTILTTS